MRQISNPMAGTDTTLLALAGRGQQQRGAFGFMSCDRAVGAAEGCNALQERRMWAGVGAGGVRLGGCGVSGGVEGIWGGGGCLGGGGRLGVGGCLGGKGCGRLGGGGCMRVPVYTGSTGEGRWLPNHPTSCRQMQPGARCVRPSQTIRPNSAPAPHPTPTPADGGWQHAYSYTNIEYTEFERLGMSDEPMAGSATTSRFPANTNVLYVSLKHALGIVEQVGGWLLHGTLKTVCCARA